MVKPGYKQTEIGVIPEEWMCKEIGSFANVCMCKRIFVEQTSDMGEIPFYKIGTFGKKADAYIPRALFEEYKRTYSYPKKGDVLISAAGTLGRTVVYDGEEAYFQDSNIIWLDIDKSQISNDYLYHYYKVIKWTPSEGSTIARLYNGIITSTNVAVPPKPEQKAIAEALSDIDTLIVNLEKLIAKKKAIKQGAMQELLTGKRRLPGFDGEWISRTIKESCSRVGVGLATSVTQYYRNSGTVIFRNLNIKPNNLDDSDILYLDTEFAMSNPSKIIRTGDVLTVHTGYVGISCVVPSKYDGALTFTTLISTTKPNVLVPEYLAYHLNSDLGHAEIENLQAGGGRNNLNVADFVKYSMFIPIDIQEQRAIVDVLMDMDKEILECESKLTKYKQIKQGMMSELLTGRIRLIDKEDA